MSHENPFAYIGGLVVLLIVGYALLATGMDMGIVIMIIIALIAGGIGGSMILQRYRRMGKHAFYNTMIAGMDPSLPLPFPEHASEIERTITPYHLQEPFNQYDEAVFGGSLPPKRPGTYNEYMTYSATGSMTINEQIAGPDIRGTLAPQPATSALPQAHPYEMRLGPQAWVDVSHAYVNTLILDPSGNIVRVMAEELAGKGVPLIFIDLQGTYRSLVTEFPFGYRLVSPQAYTEEEHTRTFAFGRDQKQQALDFGHTLLQDGWQVVFDFASYPSPDEANVILWAVVHGMAQWQQRQYQMTERHLPCVVVVTEPYRLCPDDDFHSLFRDHPETAKKVRRNMNIGLSGQGEWGMHWYLSTRKVTGIDPEALRNCRLWIIENPIATEVKAGWLTAYTGLEPETFLHIPRGQALVFDRSGRTPQLIHFRRSHSEPTAVNADPHPMTTFVLPALGEENQQPPFSMR